MSEKHSTVSAWGIYAVSHFYRFLGSCYSEPGCLAFVLLVIPGSCSQDKSIRHYAYDRMRQMTRSRPSITPECLQLHWCLRFRRLELVPVPEIGQLVPVSTLVFDLKCMLPHLLQQLREGSQDQRQVCTSWAFRGYSSALDESRRKRLRIEFLGKAGKTIARI